MAKSIPVLTFAFSAYEYKARGKSSKVIQTVNGAPLQAKTFAAGGIGRSQMQIAAFLHPNTVACYEQIEQEVLTAQSLLKQIAGRIAELDRLAPLRR